MTVGVYSMKNHEWHDGWMDGWMYVCGMWYLYSPVIKYEKKDTKCRKSRAS